MTARWDETESLQNKSGTHSAATAFAAVSEAVAVTDAAHSLTGDQPIAANSTVLAGSGAAVDADHRAARVPEGTADRPAGGGRIRAVDRHAARVPEGTANQPVARGDVRVIEPLPWLEGRRRLAVVRRVDADRDVAEMMLAHPWPELATDTDAIIAGHDSSLPFPLVVECYVRCPVWLLQVRERSGALTESLMDAIGSAVIDRNPAVEGVRTGLPLAGPADPRWRFKEDEVVEWRVLTDDCAATLLDDDDTWPLEPERLQPHSYGGSSGTAAPRRDNLRLEETVHLLATRHVAVEFRDLGPAALDPERWVEHLGRDIGMCAFAALQPTLHRALSQWDAELLQEAA